MRAKIEYRMCFGSVRGGAASSRASGGGAFKVSPGIGSQVLWRLQASKGDHATLGALSPSQIVRCQTGPLRNARQHPRTDLFALVKRKDGIWPARTRQNAV
jgi:hypothetical protein